MALTNRHGLPGAIMRALEADSYSAAGSDATVSTLHEPPRMVLLKKAHAGELSADVSERVALLLGTAFHKVMEHAAEPGDIVEKRYFCDVLGWKVSGQVDAYSPGEKHIRDWKVLSVWSVVVGDAISEYTKKLNTYAYILRANGCEVEKLSIVVLFRDWQAREARSNKDYPQQQVIEYQLDCWPQGDARRHVEQMVENHQQAAVSYERDGILIPCFPDEQWAKPEKYAVMKAGNKRATKVCDTKEEAQQFIGSTTQPMTIEHRPGELTRCMHFCPTRTVCDIGKSLEVAAEAAF